MFVHLLAFVALSRTEPVELPRLHWQERSDWVNIRRDVTPRAMGDGKTDDTAALQAGLDALDPRPGGRSTLYLPPGSYRITRTLAVHKCDGITVIGCGRDTTIVWDGPGGTGDDSRMFWSEGAPRSRYVGIVWDGRGRAHTGFDHDSHSLFETEIDHESEAFLNFTGSGFRVGHDQARPGSQAAAETTIRNCLFRRCGRGVALLQFNDYDFTLAGCEFEDCGTALYGSRGCNFYVRDSGFRRSHDVDVLVGAEHGCSIRRCSSVASKRFVEHDCIAPLTIEGCRVDAWTARDAAVVLNGGPALIFDTTFSSPPSQAAPIRASNGQHVTVCAVASPGTTTVLQETGAKVSTIPARLRKGIGPGIGSAQWFLRIDAPPSAKVLDARTRFGARGDGRTDDSAAIQRAIDAAAHEGNRAVAYLPCGDYVVSRTLVLTGRDYALEGSGIHTRLLWRGERGGTILHVANPGNLAVRNMDVGASGDENNGIDILHTGTGTAHYERVWVFGMYARQPDRKGFVARGLGRGATIVGEHVTGNLRFTDCAQARILMNTSYEGAVTVEGRGLQHDGLLGFLTRLGTGNVYGVYVHDSQFLTMSDYYVEQADRLFDLRGSAGDPSGRITISMPKDHCTQNPAIVIDGYHGLVSFGPTMPYPGGVKALEVVAQGSSALSLVWMASQAYSVPVSFRLGPSTRLTRIGNAGALDSPDTVADNGWADAAAALDDLARLGRLDLLLNYPAARPQ